MTAPDRAGQEGWHIPAHIHPLAHDGGIVYLNSQTGHWETINRRLGTVLLAACDRLDQLALPWPERQDAARLQSSPARLERLVKAGLMLPGKGPNLATPLQQLAPNDNEESEAGSLLMARSIEFEVLSPELEDAAHKGLAGALRLIKQESFPALVQQLHEARPAQLTPATMAEAQQIAAAVRQVGEQYEGRIACLELSVSAVLAGTQLDLYIGTQLGVGVDPIDTYVWPMAEGQPVRLSYDEPIAGRFHPVFTI